MTSLSPILPEQLGRLTLPQLLMLALEHEPGTRGAKTIEEYRALAAADERALADWEGR